MAILAEYFCDLARQSCVIDVGSRQPRSESLSLSLAITPGFIKASQDHSSAPFALLTSIRFFGCVSLTWPNIDFESGTITYRKKRQGGRR
ncbi:MAG: hypothetical protein WB764_20655 [Xanthobacteraceae bacterium]